MRLLEGRTAIVTGASSGIGRSSALLFAQHGADVALVARGREGLRRVADEVEGLGRRAIVVAGDVAEEETHVQAVGAVLDAFGRLDIAFNNAGTLGEIGPIETVDVEGWRRTLDINLTSAFLAARHQLPTLAANGSGSLIFTGTFVGHVLGMPGMAAYGAAKAGLVGLMRVAAVEYAARGVRVNAILPGGVDTPMGAEGAGSPDGLEVVKGLHALKRIAAPDEIAQAALYLASGMSSFVTGTAMLVDGGVTIARI
ncbi:MAG TPA: SDR family oxidoreductase [Hyphomonadaceae bacterium]|nr:SDR family oxidoreductase [Hyphomonadaceae bacterium]